MACLFHLLNVFDAFNDVTAFHGLLDSVSVAQNSQVLLQSLLNQTGRQGGEVSQFPQHLQHLDICTGNQDDSDFTVTTKPDELSVTPTGLATYLSSCRFGASLSADPPDQTEELLPHAIAFNLPALNM